MKWVFKSSSCAKISGWFGSSGEKLQLFWASSSHFRFIFMKPSAWDAFLNVSRWNSGHYFLNQVRKIQHTKTPNFLYSGPGLQFARSLRKVPHLQLNWYSFFIKNKCAWTQYLLGVITLIFFFSLKRTTCLPVVETEVKHFWNYIYFS